MLLADCKTVLAEANKAIGNDAPEDPEDVSLGILGRNKEMAKWGGEWLAGEVRKKGGEGKGLNVLTVCNTGSLATSVSSRQLRESPLLDWFSRDMARHWG